jgi:hypothetical protein
MITSQEEITFSGISLNIQNIEKRYKEQPFILVKYGSILYHAPFL